MSIKNFFSSYKSCCLILLLSHTGFTQTMVSTVQEANSAIQAAQPGATIVLKNGIYCGHINFTGYGQSNAPIILQAQTPGGVVITGDSWIKVTGKHLIVKNITFNKVENATGNPENLLVYLDSASNCRITNCVFYSCGNPYDNNGTIIYLANGSYQNMIDHCFFTRSHSISVKVEVTESQGANNHNNVIEYNYFKDIIDPPLNGDPEFNGCEPVAIGRGEGSHQNVFTTVQHNLFENTIVDSEIISNKSSKNTIQYNTLRGNNKQTNEGNRKPHLSLRGGDSCLVKGNFILDTQFGIVAHGNGHTIINNYIEGAEIGIRIRGGNSGYSNLANNIIANNTIVNSSDYGIQFGQFDQHPQGNKLYNNIIYSQITSSYRVQGIVDASNLNDWRNNISWGSSQPGNIANSGLIESNPNLALLEGLLKLQSFSEAAIDMGYPIDNLIEDMDGEERTGNPDIGADEYSIYPSIRRPLQPSDVGPNWIDSYSTFAIGNPDLIAIGKKVVRGDFDNDCNPDDIAIIYSYDGSTGIHLFSSSGSKFTYNPYWWDYPAGSGEPVTWFNFSNINHVAVGDYDSDGFIDDIAFFYNENGATAIHVVHSDGNKFIYDSFWWADPPGSENPITWFNLNNIRHVTSGDYDSDGVVDDIAVFYNENGLTAIHMLLCKWDSSLNRNDLVYDSFWWADPPGSDNPITWFHLDNLQNVVSGDYDSDGLMDDIAMFYNENGHAAMHMLLCNWDSSLNRNDFVYDSFWWADPPGSDNAITWFNLNNIKNVTSGDFDNDDQVDDLAIVYDEYGNTAIHMLLCRWNPSLGRNDFEYDSFWWADPAGSDNPITWFNLNNIANVTSGDYDNDGKLDDIAVIYDEYGSPAIHMLRSEWNASLNRNDFYYSPFWWNFSTCEQQYRCSNCCNSSVSRINKNKVTKITESIEKAEIYIFPNPAPMLFSVEGANLTNSDLELFDLTGSPVKFKIEEKSDQATRINCFDLKKGVYILKITQDKKVFYKRIVIEGYGR